MSLSRAARCARLALASSILTGCALLPSDTRGASPKTARHTGREDAAPEFDPELTDDVFSLETVIYRQQDGGGNPFVDEDASVYETVLLVERQLDPDDRAHFRALVDVISAASYDEFKDEAMSTGATGVNPGRLGIGGGQTHRFGPWSVGFSGEYQQELAYRSVHAGVDASRALNENNTTVALRLDGYMDTVRVILFDGVETGTAHRDTISAEVSVDQVLSSRSRAALTLHQTWQEGFLETSFNSVFAGGVESTEVVPDWRRRGSLTARYKHAVGPRDAVEVGYRYYEDDWGIEAHTAELRYFAHLGHTGIVLEPVYRYYEQSGADFFAFQFPTLLPLRTSDPDLGPFDGSMLGLLVRFDHKRFLGLEADWSVGAHHYDRSDGLALSWLTFGLQRSF
jgi:hypothetical protein